MSIEQNIIDAISVGAVAKIPVLFLSNPGLGKTTILKRYAEKNNMFLQTLIGSRYSNEDLAGYQVNNGGTSLTHMNPAWYEEILAKSKDGIKTLLFIDELSTCSESVQGTLLSLIFDRTIGHGKFLPKDCLIVAAANYANNLSSFMNILSPTLNRFILINLNEDYSALDMIDEFLKPALEPKYHEWKKMSEKDKEIYEYRFYEFWKGTFIKYSDPESSFGIIDISNPQIGDIYSESEGVIYNFISGRSLSYLQRSLKAYIELGIKNNEILNKIIDGLVGAGSCSFKDDKQACSYRKYLHSSLEKICENKHKEKIDMNVFTGDISKDVSNFLVNRDNLNTTATEDLVILNELVKEIKDYFKIKNILTKATEKEGIPKFISDVEAIIELQQYLRFYSDTKDIAQKLTGIAMNYYGLYCEILGTEPDFEKEFGYANKLFKKVCFIKNEKDEIYRAALRLQQKSLAAFYRIEPKENLLTATLKTPIHATPNLRVLVWDNGFKFMKINDYIRGE